MSFDLKQPTAWTCLKDEESCPDCKKLSGTVKTWGEWMNGGVLPGNGHTQCKEDCRCLLIPAEWEKDFNKGFDSDDAEDKTRAAIEAMPLTVRNVALKWRAMQEEEAGYFPDYQEDIEETVRIYQSGNDTEKGLLRDIYPKHQEFAKALCELDGGLERWTKAGRSQKRKDHIAPPIAKTVAKRKSKHMLCTRCGFVGHPKKFTKGSIWLELILWLSFLLPGLIYSIWRLASKYEGCPKCKASGMIPEDSPIAKKLMA